jgi:hypothetical protein
MSSPECPRSTGKHTRFADSDDEIDDVQEVLPKRIRRTAENTSVYVARKLALGTDRPSKEEYATKAEACLKDVSEEEPDEDGCGYVPDVDTVEFKKKVEDKCLGRQSDVEDDDDDDKDDNDDNDDDNDDDDDDDDDDGEDEDDEDYDENYVHAHADDVGDNANSPKIVSRPCADFDDAEDVDSDDNLDETVDSPTKIHDPFYYSSSSDDAVYVTTTQVIQRKEQELKKMGMRNPKQPTLTRAHTSPLRMSVRKANRPIPTTNGEARAAWARDCLAINKEVLLKGPISLMQESLPAERGKSTYKGIPVHESNCMDLGFIYNIKYSQINLAATEGHTNGTWAQIRSTAGQYARLVVSRKLVKLGSVCDEGSLFQALTDSGLVKLFLLHFKINSSSSTAATKGNHIATLAACGETYFAVKSNSRSRALLNTTHLVANAHSSTAKKEGSVRTSVANTLASRTASGKHIETEDWERLLRDVTDELACMTKSIMVWNGEAHESVSRTIEKILMNEGFVHRLNLHLNVGLLLGSCGSRSEALCGAVVPVGPDLKKFRREGLASLEVSAEKTTRAAVYKRIAVDKRLVRPITVYVQFVRRAILHKLYGPNYADNPCLLLHSRKGVALTPENLRATLKIYLKGLDWFNTPGRGQVTPRDLRWNYATLAFKRWVCTEGERPSRQEFLETLSTSMNTSVEQLNQTYITTDARDFEEVAQGFANIFADGV